VVFEAVIVFDVQLSLSVAVVSITRGTRRRRVFTTSSEVSAGWNITAKSPSTTTL